MWKFSQNITIYVIFLLTYPYFRYIFKVILTFYKENKYFYEKFL